ncbi:DsbA family protein [Bifidobacterium callitrichidarum]|uniref:Disulfide bond formation protein DsbA n=1 Tax=Bifidobacterium callitrichidarum TaxID=2052941 RepID=A0A2U2NCC5_9BIFI|nr:thioredoxin domain-containing protein [Bifidobacterium callitrichidarum]PWG66684.1 disulfide bond formation protein DsbA [Bifidobacterium callitrichidarum]
MTTNQQETIKPSNSHHMGPWVWLVGILSILLAIMTFAVGYLLASSKTANNAQTAQTQTGQQPEPDMKQLAKTLNSVNNKPKRAGKTGGILFSKNGYNKPIKNVPTIGLYEEPLCPYCGQLNRTIDPTITKLFEAGQINVDLYLVNFLNQNSSDDYSNRAANGAVYIAEHDDNPTHLLAYMTNIYTQDFQPQEGDSYKPVSNDQLKEQAVKAGVDPAIADKAFSGVLEYKDWLEAANNYTTSNPKVQNPQGGFSTPTITVNGNYWPVDSSNPDVTSKLLNAIDLKENQVGGQSKPSIGSNKKPIA